MSKTQPRAPEPARIDTANACLRRGGQAIALTPKAFSVLLYLSEHPARLVTKQELLDAVWPRGHVTDGVLKGCVREIRKALDDRPTTPHYIETLHRRGYRLIHDLRAAGARPRQPATIRPPESAILIGREEALARLHGCLGRALGGQRQVVFVGGEAGIGKTAVVDAFVGHLAKRGRVLLGRGQCIEQYSVGEAYSPVLDALSEICRQPEGGDVVPLLGRYAPSWLAQLPWLGGAGDEHALRRETLNPTRERMLREMSELLEALTARTPVLLVLEDLHWSDHSTIDLVSMLARRRDAARLMLVITYRPVEVILTNHPLKSVRQDLQVRASCEDLPLSYLSQEDVGAYLAARFAGHALPPGLAAFVHERTEGNPLFMVTMVNYLLAHEPMILSASGAQVPRSFEDLRLGVPENLRQMIERQLERHSPEEQRVLEAASVAGVEFTAAAVAAALDADEERTEEQLLHLARNAQFVRENGIDEWPDGTVSARYAFIHALYQNVLYEHQPATSRVQCHRRVGERLQRGFTVRTGRVAAELALHFEQGRDFEWAIAHFRAAAGNAAARYANREAVGYLTRALTLADRLPEQQRSDTYMTLLGQRGHVRRVMADMQGAAEDFEALAAYAGEHSRLDRQATALIAGAIVLSWVDRGRCLATVAELKEISTRLGDAQLRAHAHGWSAYWHLLWRGWRNEDAYASARAVRAARRTGDSRQLNLLLGRYSYFQCLRSRYAAAAQVADRASRLALRTESAFEYLLAHFFRAWALLHLGEWGRTNRVLGHGLEVAEKNGQHLWALLFRLELAWLSIETFAFSTARDLAERGLEEARRYRLAYAEVLSQILLGRAHIGLAQYECAFQCFHEVRQRLARERILMDWILRMPLNQGFSEYWLLRRDYPRARRYAGRLYALASRPGERTYQALGLDTLARVALAQGHGDEAEAELLRALKLLERRACPLAQWRINATAVAHYQHQGRVAEADRCRAASRAVLTGLADSLTDVPPLRESLLKAKPVRKILRRGASRRR